MVYTARVMRLFRSWRFAHPASFLTIAILLCLGVGGFLFCGAAVPKSEVSAALTLTMAGTPHAEQVADGYGSPIDGNYLAMTAEDGELSDKLPVGATLLTALVLVAFFETALGWLLAFARTRRRSQLPSLIGRWSRSMVRLHRRRAVATLLGVFRL